VKSCLNAFKGAGEVHGGRPVPIPNRQHPTESANNTIGRTDALFMREKGTGSVEDFLVGGI